MKLLALWVFGVFSSLLATTAGALEPQSAGGVIVDVFTSGQGGYKCYKIPTLFTSSTGVLLAIAEARGGDCMDWQDTDLVLKRSTDGGATWDNNVSLMVPGGYNKHNVAGNIAIVQDKTTGRIWMPFTKGNWEFYMTYSDDDGVSWKEPYQLHGLKKFGETWVGFGPPSGIQTTSGRLLLPCYASSVPIYDNGIFTYSFVVYSDDNGMTWHRGARVPSGGWFFDFFTGNFGNEAEIVEFETSKKLLISSRAAWGNRIQSISYDDGESWSKYEDTTLPNPMMGCEGSVVGLGDDMGILFSGPDTDEVIRTDMKVYKSADQGARWTEAYHVDTIANGESETVGYSSLIRMNDGTTAVIWGRSEETATLFVPDYISFRTLPASLHGSARDVSGYTAPSGTAYSMDWQAGYSFDKFNGTVPFWCLLVANCVLIVFQTVFYIKRIALYCKTFSKRHDNVKTGEDKKGCCNLGCCARVFFRRSFYFLTWIIAVLGTAAQTIFRADDGARWLYQSVNVLLFQIVCMLLIIIIPFALKMSCKSEEDEELDLISIQVASATNDGSVGASAPPQRDVELGGRTGRRTSL